jgi:hypothetical protein
VGGDALGARVGDGQSRTGENETTGGGGSGDDLLEHLFLLVGKRDPKMRIT